ncbi:MULTISPECIES: hypothetical protein [Burkholderia]|uniref:hypothetical protein n=1 Tax=Burkholderia TaxID=32008 RepID=UPI00117C7F37|nr:MULTISPECIES: hypothetical protein [Burkholderia]
MPIGDFRLPSVAGERWRAGNLFDLSYMHFFWIGNLSIFHLIFSFVLVFELNISIVYGFEFIRLAVLSRRRSARCARRCQ